MNSLLATAPAVNTPPRRRGRPSHDDTLLGALNDRAWGIKGAMHLQLGDLDEVMDLNAQEDENRAKLGGIVRALGQGLKGTEKLAKVIGKHLAAGKVAEAGMVAEAVLQNLAVLCVFQERAESRLAIVDILDAKQGLNRGEQPIKRARKRNREAAVLAQDIIDPTEPGAVAAALRTVD